MTDTVTVVMPTSSSTWAPVEVMLVSAVVGLTAMAKMAPGLAGMGSTKAHLPQVKC